MRDTVSVTIWRGDRIAARALLRPRTRFDATGWSEIRLNLRGGVVLFGGAEYPGLTGFARAWGHEVVSHTPVETGTSGGGRRREVLLPLGDQTIRLGVDGLTIEVRGRPRVWLEPSEVRRLRELLCRQAPARLRARVWHAAMHDVGGFDLLGSAP